jgi:hypothetical protein
MCRLTWHSFLSQATIISVVSDIFKLVCYFCAGYDVYLGNLRGLASREHVDKHISSKR